MSHLKPKGLKRMIYILALPLLGAWLTTFAQYGEVWPFSNNAVGTASETPWGLFRKTFFGLATVAFAIVDLPDILGRNTREKRLSSYSNEDNNNG